MVLPGAAASGAAKKLPTKSERSARVSSCSTAIPNTRRRSLRKPCPIVLPPFNVRYDFTARGGTAHPNTNESARFKSGLLHKDGSSQGNSRRGTGKSGGFCG